MTADLCRCDRRALPKEPHSGVRVAVCAGINTPFRVLLDGVEIAEADTDLQALAIMRALRVVVDRREVSL